VTCMCVINSILVSDMLVSQYMHPAGWCAPFLGSPSLPKCRGYRPHLCLCALSKTDGVVTVKDKSLNGTIVNGAFLGKDLSCQISPQDVVSLAQVIVNAYLNLCLCVHIYNPFMCHCMLKGQRHHASKTHDANKQHESSCLIFLFLFLLALLRTYLQDINTH